VASVGKRVNFFELCVHSCEFSVICLNVDIVCGFLLKILFWNLKSPEFISTRYMHFTLVTFMAVLMNVKNNNATCCLGR